jgi:hypothetical protein
MSGRQPITEVMRKWAGLPDTGIREWLMAVVVHARSRH